MAFELWPRWEGARQTSLWEEGANCKGQGHVVGRHMLCSNTAKQVTECTEWRGSNERLEPDMSRNKCLGEIKVSSGMTHPISPSSGCRALHLTQCLATCDSLDAMLFHFSMAWPLPLLPFFDTQLSTHFLWWSFLNWVWVLLLLWISLHFCLNS